MNKKEQENFNKRVVYLLNDIVNALTKEEISDSDKEYMLEQVTGLGGLIQP